MDVPDETTTEAPTETPAGSPNEAQGFESLLAEYAEAAEGKVEEKVETPAQDTPELVDLRSQVSDLQEERDFENLQRREASDTAAVFAQARSDIAGLEGMPDNFSETWLRNEYMTNAEIQHAWDHRYDSEEAMHHASRLVDRAMRNLVKDAKLEESRIAGIAETQDRAAVVAAMTRGRGRAPETPPPQLSHVSDQEFRDDVKKRYGFNVPI